MKRMNSDSHGGTLLQAVLKEAFTSIAELREDLVESYA